jgi:hypothetical protein
LGVRFEVKRYGFKNMTNPNINNTATPTSITQSQIETPLSFLSSILVTSFPSCGKMPIEAFRNQIFSPASVMHRDILI